MSVQSSWWSPAAMIFFRIDFPQNCELEKYEQKKAQRQLVAGGRIFFCFLLIFRSVECSFLSDRHAICDVQTSLTLRIFSMSCLKLQSEFIKKKEWKFKHAIFHFRWIFSVYSSSTFLVVQNLLNLEWLRICLIARVGRKIFWIFRSPLNFIQDWSTQHLHRAYTWNSTKNREFLNFTRIASTEKNSFHHVFIQFLWSSQIIFLEKNSIKNSTPCMRQRWIYVNKVKPDPKSTATKPTTKGDPT